MKVKGAARMWQTQVKLATLSFSFIKGIYAESPSDQNKKKILHLFQQQKR